MVVKNLLRFLCAAILSWTLAEPVLAVDRSAWQELMKRGCFARNEHDFLLAEQSFNDALRAADSLSEHEKIQALFELAELHELRSNYPQAEECYRKAIAISPDSGTYVTLAILLEKQKRLSEAKQIRAEHPWKPDNASAAKWMKRVVQPTIKKRWYPGTKPHSQYSVVKFRLPAGIDQSPIAYLSDSAGDDALDKASLNAVEGARLTTPPDIDEPVMVQFTFDYNNFKGGDQRYAAELGPIPVARLREQYADLRKRLEEQEKNLGPEHVEVASTMCEAAKILAQIKQRKTAMTAYKRAIEIFEQNRDTSINSIIAYEALGNLYLRDKQYVDAEACFRKSLKRVEDIYPAGSKNIDSAKLSLIRALTKQKRKEEAAELKASLRKAPTK